MSEKLGILLNENAGSSANNKISEMPPWKVWIITLSLPQSSLTTTSILTLAQTDGVCAKPKMEAVVGQNYTLLFNKYLRSLSLQTRKPCCRKETARCRSCSFRLKFADDIHYKLFKSSPASKAKLQSSKHTGAKQNLTQNGDSKSFKVTCFGVSGKAIRRKVILYNNVGLIC